MIEEIIKTARTSINGRRFFTSEQKSYIVKEWEGSNQSAAEFCRRYGLIVNILYSWRRNANRGAQMGIQNDGELHSKTELDALKKENENLKIALGESQLDIRILKKKLEMDAEKDRLERIRNSQENSK